MLHDSANGRKIEEIGRRQADSSFACCNRDTPPIVQAKR
jgi:hypothetical protein